MSLYDVHTPQPAPYPHARVIADVDLPERSAGDRERRDNYAGVQAAAEVLERTVTPEAHTYFRRIVQVAQSELEKLIVYKVQQLFDPTGPMVTAELAVEELGARAGCTGVDLQLPGMPVAQGVAAADGRTERALLREPYPTKEKAMGEAKHLTKYLVGVLGTILVDFSRFAETILRWQKCSAGRGSAAHDAGIKRRTERAFFVTESHGGGAASAETSDAANAANSEEAQQEFDGLIERLERQNQQNTELEGKYNTVTLELRANRRDFLRERLVWQERLRRAQQALKRYVGERKSAEICDHNVQFFVEDADDAVDVETIKCRYEQRIAVLTSEYEEEVRTFEKEIRELEIRLKTSEDDAIRYRRACHRAENRSSSKSGFSSSCVDSALSAEDAPGALEAAQQECAELERAMKQQQLEREEVEAALARAIEDRDGLSLRVSSLEAAAKRASEERDAANAAAASARAELEAVVLEETRRHSNISLPERHRHTKEPPDVQAPFEQLSSASSGDDCGFEQPATEARSWDHSKLSSCIPKELVIDVASDARLNEENERLSNELQEAQRQLQELKAKDRIGSVGISRYAQTHGIEEDEELRKLRQTCEHLREKLAKAEEALRRALLKRRSDDTKPTKLDPKDVRDAKPTQFDRKDANYIDLYFDQDAVGSRSRTTTAHETGDTRSQKFLLAAKRARDDGKKSSGIPFRSSKESPPAEDDTPDAQTLLDLNVTARSASRAEDDMSVAQQGDDLFQGDAIRSGPRRGGGAYVARSAHGLVHPWTKEDQLFELPWRPPDPTEVLAPAREFHKDAQLPMRQGSVMRAGVRIGGGASRGGRKLIGFPLEFDPTLDYQDTFLTDAPVRTDDACASLTNGADAAAGTSNVVLRRELVMPQVDPIASITDGVDSVVPVSEAGMIHDEQQYMTPPDRNETEWRLLEGTNISAEGGHARPLTRPASAPDMRLCLGGGWHQLGPVGDAVAMAGSIAAERNSAPIAVPLGNCIGSSASSDARNAPALSNRDAIIDVNSDPQPMLMHEPEQGADRTTQRNMPVSQPGIRPFSAAEAAGERSRQGGRPTGRVVSGLRPASASATRSGRIVARSRTTSAGLPEVGAGVRGPRRRPASAPRTGALRSSPDLAMPSEKVRAICEKLRQVRPASAGGKLCLK